MQSTNQPYRLQKDLPQNWEIEATDYHDFKYAKYAYDKLVSDVDYEEIGMNGGNYIALFYIGEKPVNLISMLKNEYSK